MSTPSPDEAIRPELLLLLAFVVVAAVYAPTLGAGFMWDDRLLIVEAPLVRQLGPLREYFTEPFWSASANGAANASYFRPLAILSYALDWRLHHGNPAGFHLTNLVLHVLNAGLVYAYVRRFTATGLMAVAAATLWALNPRLAEAAAWVSGRTDLLCTSFVLLALCLPNTRVGRWGAAFALLLAFLTKEAALAGVAALLVRSFVDPRDAARPSRLALLAPPLAALVAYLTLRAVFYGFSVQGSTLGVLPRLGTVIEALGRYAFMLVVPWSPSALLGRMGALDAKFVLLGVLTLAALLASIPRLLRAFRERALWLEPLALALVGVALVLHVVPIPTRTVAADRFLYLPLVGVIAAAAPSVERWLGRSGLVRLGLLGVCVSILISAVYRVRAWSDEIAFWAAEQRRSPESSVALIELNGIYYRAGLYAEALELSRRALQTNDGWKLAAYNAFLNLKRLGRISEARAQLSELEARSQKSYAKDFALLDLQEFEFNAARREFERLHRDAPRSTDPSELLQLTAGLERSAARLRDPSFAASEAGRALRAQLATRVQRNAEASELWLELLRSAQDPALVRVAASQVMRLGSIDQMNQAIDTLRSRGNVPDGIAEAYLARASEIEAALKGKALLGL